mmetsp:Transcript_49475/g.72574  ORF Transcript_49475/g.72574 Transcript_49475/m.72574 type:complete len:147 (-) Transcript_49475:1538-1978(-)
MYLSLHKQYYTRIRAHTTVTLGVEPLQVLWVPEPVQNPPEWDKSTDEKGESDSQVADTCRRIQDAKQHHLEECEAVHSLHGDLLGVLVTGKVIEHPNAKELHPIKELVAGDTSNAHEEEDTKEHRPWNEFQNRCEGEGDQDESVDQ